VRKKIGGIDNAWPAHVRDQLIGGLPNASLSRGRYLARSVSAIAQLGQPHPESDQARAQRFGWPDRNAWTPRAAADQPLPVRRPTTDAARWPGLYASWSATLDGRCRRVPDMLVIQPIWSRLLGASPGAAPETHCQLDQEPRSASAARESVTWIRTRACQPWVAADAAPTSVHPRRCVRRFASSLAYATDTARKPVTGVLGHLHDWSDIH
jgi:hypothetical protein